MTATFSFAGLSDAGLVRTENQDRWYADPLQGLFIVSDGMGGGPAGGLAADIVVQTLPALIHQILDRDDGDSGTAAEAVLLALSELSDRVRDESSGQPGLDGMGATVVLALLRGDYVLIGQMGDSRAYLYRQESLELLTRDHSITQLLLNAGEISVEEAVEHPGRSQLTRFVGMAGEALPETRSLPFLLGDRFLLCSDGLTGMLTDEEISTILAQRLPPTETCRTLVDLANAAGGKDNVSVVVIDVRPHA